VIAFDTDEGRFTLRVAGIAIVEERVLLHRAVGDDYWVLPGGRVEMMEQARQTLAREMMEETVLAFDAGRLVWVMENFFTWQGRPFHEIGLYFEMTPREPPEAWEFEGREGADYLKFRWAPLESLGELTVQPAFLRLGLLDLPAVATHVVQV